MTTTDHHLAALAKPPPGIDSAVQAAVLRGVGPNISSSVCVAAATVEAGIVGQAMRPDPHRTTEGSRDEVQDSG
jgi:hypothetical protein